MMGEVEKGLRARVCREWEVGEVVLILKAKDRRVRICDSGRGDRRRDVDADANADTDIKGEDEDKETTARSLLRLYIAQRCA